MVSPMELLTERYAKRLAGVLSCYDRIVITGTLPGVCFYEADPLQCPKCNGPMRVVALIEDPGIIRRILEHLGLWAPLATERSPPLGPASWPRYGDLPLTYHPVPDIA